MDGRKERKEGHSSSHNLHCCLCMSFFFPLRLPILVFLPLVYHNLRCSRITDPLLSALLLLHPLSFHPSSFFSCSLLLSFVSSFIFFRCFFSLHFQPTCLLACLFISLLSDVMTLVVSVSLTCFSMLLLPPSLSSPRSISVPIPHASPLRFFLPFLPSPALVFLLSYLFLCF